MNKYLYALFTLAVIFCKTSFAQPHWSTTNVFHGRDVNTLKYVTPRTLIAAGGSEINDSLQAFLRSGDYGINWEDHSTNCGCVTIKSLDFIDTLNGFAVGIGGNMKKTVDAGYNWTLVNSPVYRNWHKVIYLNATTLIAVGGWQKDSLRQTVIKSTDGGNNWTVMYDQPGPSLRSVNFIDQLTGYAVGDSGAILRTINGGTSWVPRTSPIVRNFNAIDFATADTGYIVGGRRYNDSLRTILRTVNGGLNWATVKDEPGAWLTDVFFVDNNIGKIVGDRATLLNTADGGLNWLPETIPGSVPGQYFTSVYFLNSTHGAIGTHFGTIFLYNNITAPQVTTEIASPVDSTNAILRGTVNSFGYPAFYVFHLTTDSTFTTNVGTTYPAYVNFSSPAPVTFNLSSLTPLTKYYYFIEATSAGGKNASSKLSFTTTPNYLLITQPATGITATSAQLNGLMANGFGSPATLYFEYGTDSNVTNQVAASPNIVNDTLQHTASATISSLQPNTFYYFRIKAVINGNNYYGALLGFFNAGFPFAQLETQGATHVTDSSANLNATISGALAPCNVYFEYGATPLLGDTLLPFPSFINDTATYNFNMPLFQLPARKVYYFRITAATPANTYHGNILTFYTDETGFAIRTNAATMVTATTAQLNGTVNNLGEPVTIGFDYGLTTQLGNSINAIPNQVNDSLSHDVTAAISGLQPDKTYYVRIKALTASGNTFYGDIKRVYTGNPVPNWDFQFWKHDTLKFADGWNFLGDDYERVPGHSGNYALKVTNTTGAFLGLLFENNPSSGTGSGLIGGVPFQARPDSLVMYLNYSFGPLDTGAVGLRLYNANNDDICTNLFALDGSTGGTFKRCAFPITYNTNQMPDSLVVGVLNAVPDLPHKDTGDFIIADDISTVPATPFMYNDFEEWYDYPHHSLLQWAYIKHAFATRNNINAQPMVTQSIYSAPNDYAAELHNVPFQNVWIGSEISSRTTGFGAKNGDGFPVSAHHQTLNGYYKWYPVNKDSAWIDVVMWGGGEQLGMGQLAISDSATQFVPFEVPITYSIAGMPDKAVISIRSYYNGIAKGPSRMVVDKLSFDGFYFAPNDTTGIRNITTVFDEVKIYPNPAQHQITVESVNKFEASSYIRLFDLNGRIAKAIKVTDAINKVSFETDDIPAGFYLIQFNAGDKTFKKKVVVIK